MANGSEQFGYFSVVLKLDTYSHVPPSMQKAATDKLAVMLFGRASAKETITRRNSMKTPERAGELVIIIEYNRGEPFAIVRALASVCL